MKFFNLLIPIVFYSLYSIVVLIKTTINISRKEYDELEKKSIVDSLAITAVIIIVIHLIQLILMIFNLEYKPVITTIRFNHAISLSGYVESYGYYVNSLIVDCCIFSLTYSFNRVKYGLITGMATLF